MERGAIYPAFKNVPPGFAFGAKKFQNAQVGMGGTYFYGVRDRGIDELTQVAAQPSRVSCQQLDREHPF